MSPAFYREVDKKAKLMREDYGGMMRISDLCRELRLCKNRVRPWLREHGVEGCKIGRSDLYETDQVARAIVASRGMV